MKFLCDNCKAKYQIADEKVAGKTVRMKCRKCGHQIEVRAAITETSVSMAPPKGDSAPPRGLATSLTTNTGASSARPKPPTPSHAPEGALAGAFQRTVDDRSVSISVQETPGALSVTDEWYVAINGVPVGPVRLSELRRKAAAGSVTEDSLAWQEGLEEWRPVRSLPELAAIVREAALGNRPSLLAPPTPSKPPPPPAARPRPSQAPPTPRRPDVAPATQRLEEGRSPAPGRSNVVPLHGDLSRRSAASADGDLAPMTSPLAPAARGSAALAPAASVSIAPKPPTPSQAPRPLTPAPFAATAPMATPDPFAVPAADPFAVKAPLPVAPLTSSASFAPPPSVSAAPAPARRGAPLWFWPVLAFAIVFGGFAAYRLIDKPQAERVIVQVPTPAAPTAAPAPTETAAPAPEASASAAPSAKATSTAPRVATGAATAPAATGPKTADLSGLLGGAGGPAVGGGSATGPSAGGGLDSATVQRIVRERSPGVKRACWERGGGDTKSSAKVNVAITVAANGRVQGAQATGDDPVVAKCIENQVRNWSFPAPGAETTINVPFVFVRQ